MNDNPYQASSARIAQPRPQHDNVPEEIAKRIRNGAVAAFVSGGITTILSFIALFTGENILGLGASSLFDAALIFGLAYGIHRRSRICAVLMLVYFVLSKIIQVAAMGQVTGIPISLLFLYFYVMAVIGTFQYRAWRLRTGAP